VTPHPPHLAGVHEMVNIGGLDAAAAAHRLNSAHVHVVFDLMGWIPEGRQVPTFEMLSFRPCAVQVVKEVHATSGAPFIDYILSDFVAVPPEHASLFAESFLAMPPSLLPNSHRSNYKLHLLQQHHEHMECEWDTKKVALLALYEHYKLDPLLFARWLSIVQMYNASSVLVVQEGAYPALSTPVFERLASQWHLSPSNLLRLPWAQSHAQYIQRMGCGRAVLLDPAHYSAHTVAVDALWAGSAVVTRAGPRLVSRIAASLLFAMGMHKLLIVRTWQDYTTLVSQLIKFPRKIAQVQLQIKEARDTAPLFEKHFFKSHLVRLASLAFEAHTAAQSDDVAPHSKIPHSKMPHVVSSSPSPLPLPPPPPPPPPHAVGT